MRKIHYSKIHIDKELSLKLFKFMAAEHTNSYRDEQGKFIKGAEKIRDVHEVLYETLIYLLIKKTIVPGNLISDIKGESVYNVTKPLLLKATPMEISNNAKKGCYAIHQTIKNRMDRLEKLGAINRKWSRDDGMFYIEFSPEFLILKDAANGELIKNIGFEKYSLLNDCKRKNEKTSYTLNQNSNINNKIIHSSNVDKRDLQMQMPSSSKSEHLENKNKKVQLRLTQENLETNKYEKPETNTKLAGERLKHMELASKKKDAANLFYTKFIALFWDFWMQLYLPETAPRQNLHYIAQSIDTLVNDSFYFGSCQNEQEIKYQEQKLNKALRSAGNWYKAKQKDNPQFSFRYLYPNTFLGNKAGKGSMSFKNSVLRAEISMAKNNEMQMDYEKAMQRQNEKATKERHNLIVDNLIAHIYSNPKENTKNMMLAAQQYLLEIHPELVMKLATDISNPYRVKQAIENIQKPDKQLIDDCFNGQQKLEKQINELLPKMQKLLLANKIGQSPKLFSKFNIRGAEKQPIPKNWNKETLKYIQFLMK